MFNPKKLMVGILMFTLLSPQALAEQSRTDYRTVSFPVAAVNLVPNAYINMYKISSMVASIYAGELVSSNTTGAQGEPVKFAVNSGDIVSFVAFTNKDKALNVTRWNFTSAPYKNFAAEDGIGERLCQINGTDRSTKLIVNGAESCVTSLNVPTGDNTVAIAAASLTASPITNFEVWVQQTSNPQTKVQDASVRLLDAGTREIIAQTTNGSRGVATFIIERGRKFYYEAYKNNVGYGGYTTQYTSTPRVFYISADKDEIIGDFDGQRSTVMRLNAYPNPSLTPSTIPPTPTHTPDPAPTITPAVTDKPIIISPEQYQVLTNYPRIATITWRDVTNAVSYEIGTECDTCSLPTWSNRSALSIVTVPSFTTEPLNGDNMYRVHLRGIARNGVRGPWSDYRYFKYNTAVPTPPAPVTPTPPSNYGDIDDFVEYNETVATDIELLHAAIQYGRRVGTSQYGFRSSVKFSNSSKSYEAVVMNAKCTTKVNGTTYDLINTTKVISGRPGQKTFTFFEAVNDSQREALLLSKQNNGTVNCSFVITGILDDYTGALTADANASNNTINLELTWKAGRLQTNAMGRN